MLVKVKLGKPVNIKNLVSVVSPLPCGADLQSGTFVIDAKSLLGVLSMPLKEFGALNIHSDEPELCSGVISRLRELDLLSEEEPVQKTTYLVSAMGEMLIDFTMQGKNEEGQRMFAQNPGGAPANVMAAMSKLGARTAFIGKAGDDMHGRFLKETLDNCGINSDGFTLSKEYFTTLAFVDVKPGGEREFSFARNHGADKMIEKSDVPLDIIRSSGIFHIGSVSLTEEPARGATIFAVEKAKKAGCVISYDPNYRASLWKNEETAVKHMRSMLEYADIVKISDEETALLTDKTAPEAAARELIGRGIKIAVVTLGADGAYVRTKTGGVHIPGFKCKAVDATGAGDAFWAGFLYQFGRYSKKPEEVTLQEAAEFARFGNAVASLCVEHRGAIPAMPEMAQVQSRMDSLK